MANFVEGFCFGLGFATGLMAFCLVVVLVLWLFMEWFTAGEERKPI